MKLINYLNKYRQTLTKTSMVILVMVLSVFMTACSSKKGDEGSAAKKDVPHYQFYIDAKSDANLLFSTYDIEIHVDDQYLGAIPNGEYFTQLIELEEGKHVLVFSEAGNSSNKAEESFELTGDKSFSCELEHGMDKITLKNTSYKDGVTGSSLEMPDVVGMILSEAEKKLEQTGFVNVTHEGEDASIWDTDNWLIISQSVAAGTTVDKTAEINLVCRSLDDYFEETFKGLNVIEAKEKAVTLGFKVAYYNEDGDNVTEYIASLPDSEKEALVAVGARQASLSNDTVAIVVPYDLPDSESSSESSSKSEDKYITVDNNEMFRKIMTTNDTTYEEQKEFFEENRGKLIKFLGSLDDQVTNGYIMDLLFSYGPYSETTQTGPTLKADDCFFMKIDIKNREAEYTELRDYMWITAKIMSYDEDTGMVFIDVKEFDYKTE